MTPFPHKAPRALVVMGVSGCGKSTVAAMIAHRLGYAFIEGDRLHPPENVAKMRAGIPLEDADRWPWLDRLGAELRGAEGVAATCSALKRAYRDRLRAARPDLVFVYLKGSPDLFAARVAARRTRSSMAPVTTRRRSRMTFHFSPSAGSSQSCGTSG